nr:MAG TPA_asm: hypothetical protein [Caudoviricetes sp.]
MVSLKRVHRLLPLRTGQHRPRPELLPAIQIQQ